MSFAFAISKVQIPSLVTFLLTKVLFCFPQSLWAHAKTVHQNRPRHNLIYRQRREINYKQNKRNLHQRELRNWR